MTIVYAIILFVILIFPHELGHFLVAKAVGVKVNEFAFGMGPAILKKQRGETLYAIRVLPIGGYCAMEGENEESDNSRAFNNKPGWAKILVLLAGSAMNVLIAIIVLSLIIGIKGSPTTFIGQVEKDSPAYEVGLENNSEIISIDGNQIDQWSDMVTYINKPDNIGKELSFVIEKDGEQKNYEITPKYNKDTNSYIIGAMTKKSHSPYLAVKNGLISTGTMVSYMYDSLLQLITGKVSTDEIAGPVGMIQLVSDTNKYGLSYFGYLLALISLNLAIINMLPLPALDGGRIIFVIIRKITGKMISDDLEGKIHGAGMILLFGFMIFITWNDITRLFS